MKVFVGEKEDPLIWRFFAFLIRVYKRIIYRMLMDYFWVLKLFPGDPILDHDDFRDPLYK